jgi:glutathione S-transferase
MTSVTAITDFQLSRRIGLPQGPAVVDVRIDDSGQAAAADLMMSEPILFGSPFSTFVHIVRLVLTHKGVAYTFRDLETEMGKPNHLALHPLNRMPVLQHDGITVHESTAIATYIDETFEKPALQPKNVRDRARMQRWFSAVNSYYYTYMIYHVVHERLVLPRLGIASDEWAVAQALQKVDAGLQVLERELAHGKSYLLGAELTLADFYLLPCTFSFSLTEEGKTMYPRYPAFCRWRETMEALPSVQRFRASLPPRGPMERAREWGVPSQSTQHLGDDGFRARRLLRSAFRRGM